MSECNYGCSRDYLIRDVVALEMAADEGCKQLLASIRLMREAGVDPKHIDLLMRDHATLCRAKAESADRLFNQIGVVLHEHRAWDPVAWLATDHARHLAQGEAA